MTIAPRDRSGLKGDFAKNRRYFPGKQVAARLVPVRLFQPSKEHLSFASLLKPNPIRHMKLSSLLNFSAFLVVASLPASATVNITPSATPITAGTMPGLAADYVFFGNPADFPGLPYYGVPYGGTNPPQPGVLTDFSLTAGSDAGGQYAGTSGYSTINGPVGSSEPSIATGDLFGPGSSGGDKPDIANFTLGTPGSTFNFSDFYVYVMFGNGPGDANDHITDIDFSVVSSFSSPLATITPVAVTDENTSTSVAYFEKFEITGASAGDIIEIGTGADAPSSSYLGGVSFDEAPEPSTWALMIAGLSFLGFRMRNKVARYQA
jgi:hypothetical protein